MIDPETQRVENWLKKFYESLRQDNSDLIPLYDGRILFMPNQNGGKSLNPSLMELDERYATEEQIRRMWNLFKKYTLQHRV